MSKAKTKEMTIVSVDPRVRMKEIRSLVARAVKDKARIDLMSFNAEDQARVTIALQDLVDRERTRHAKAREHIISQKEFLESTTNFYSFLMDHASARSLEDAERLGELGKERNRLLNHNENLTNMLTESFEDNRVMKLELSAALLTLKGVMKNA